MSGFYPSRRPVMSLPVFAMNADVAYPANMPAAQQFLAVSNRVMSRIDLSGFREARIAVRVRTVGFAGALLYPGYAPALADPTNPNGTTEFVDLCSPRASVAIDVLGAFISPWQPIVAAARTEIWIAPLGIGGNGVVNPAFGGVTMFFR